jgi:hypothetical protein
MGYYCSKCHTEARWDGNLIRRNCECSGGTVIASCSAVARGSGSVNVEASKPNTLLKKLVCFIKTVAGKNKNG